MQRNMKKYKTNTEELNPVYNIILTKKIKGYNKGDSLFIGGLDIVDFSKFLGSNGYPFGYAGNIGDFHTTFSKEILENIVIIKGFRTITTITEFHKIEDFK